MPVRSSAVLLIILSFLAISQTYTIDTFAGGRLFEGVPATSADLGWPYGVAVDRAGNVYMALYYYDIVLKVTPQGDLIRVAGNGTRGFSGDGGAARNAELADPVGVAVDSADNLYIADSFNQRVRKVSNGIITTVAGSGNSSLGDNGPATSAGMSVTGIAVDGAGNLYIADWANNRIRKVTNGVITTVAGGGTQGDGAPATSAQLISPSSIAVDGAGNLYISEPNAYRVRKVAGGVISTIAGSGVSGSSGDGGPATSATLSSPRGLAVDSAGSVYIADYNYSVRKVSGGVITTVTSAVNPRDVAVDAKGNLYIAEVNRVRMVSGGAITTVAGGVFGGAYLGDGGPASAAQLMQPDYVTLDATGNVYISDSADGLVRKVVNGTVSTVAGGSSGYRIEGVAVDAGSNVYVADLSGRVYRLSPNGVSVTVAGNGNRGFAGDNVPADAAQLNYPYGIALDKAGSLYIADSGNNRIRKVSGGVITTVAGNGGAGYSGDDGPATSAQLNQPQGVAVDSNGDLYIADTMNGRIRMVSGGTITTVAGGGVMPPGGNVPATSVWLSSTQSDAVDASGNLYISSGQNLYKVSGGMITTLVASPDWSFYGKGIALDAATGKIYAADSLNNVVHVLTPVPLSIVTVSPLPQTAVGAMYTQTLAATGGIPQYTWSLAAGSLPTGLSLSASGTISGTPAAIGTFTFTAQATDGAGKTAAVSLTLVVLASCPYSLGFSGASFPAAGGTGSATVATASGCSWSASNSLSWVTNVIPASATGSATVTFQVAANASSGRSGALTIAGLPFTVQQAGSVSGLNFIGSMPQIPTGGFWNTSITLMNNSSAAATARLNFLDANGNALQLPLTFPQTSSTSPLLASALDQTIAPGAAFVIQTAGAPGDASASGWVQLLATGNISGFAVFGWNPGGGVQQAVAPLEIRNPGSFVLYYDNTGNTAEGVALINVAAQAATVPVIVRDDAGTVLATTSESLAAHGHVQFMVTDLSALTANKRGTVEFQTPAGGQIGVLGIQALSTGAITSVPATTK